MKVILFSAHLHTQYFLCMARGAGRRRPDMRAAMLASWAAARDHQHEQTSLRTRYEIVRRRLAGQRVRDIAATIKVSPTTVTFWTARFLSTGTE